MRFGFQAQKDIVTAILGCYKFSNRLTSVSFAIAPLNASFTQPYEPTSGHTNNYYTPETGGGRVVQRCWVNFHCRGVLLIWIIVGQGPIALAIGAGGGCLDIFSLIYQFSFLSPSLWETARYRMKYYLKGPLNSDNQPTNQQSRNGAT